MTQPRTGGEKQILSAFLDQQRDVVLWKLDGLTENQLRQPITPGGLDLLPRLDPCPGVALPMGVVGLGWSSCQSSSAWTGRSHRQHGKGSSRAQAWRSWFKVTLYGCDIGSLTLALG